MRTTRLVAPLAGVSLVLAGCGGSPEAAPTAPSAAPRASGSTQGAKAYPVTIENCGYQQTFERKPSRVVILNGTSVGEVESFLTLDLGDTILANAQSYGVSDDPTMVKRIKALPTRGMQKMGRVQDIPAEQLMAMKPDLVVSTWTGGFDPKRGFATREELHGAGIRTLVNPVNCGYGKTNPTAAEKKARDGAGVESTFAFLQLLGKVFDKPEAANQAVRTMRKDIAAVEKAVQGRPRPKALIAFPGMSMMNANGLPAVMAGGIYDDVLAKAGTVNAFAGKGRRLTSSLSKEQLAAADVDILVIGGFTPDEDLDAEARKLFAAYPQWSASKNQRYVKVSDGVYLGPNNRLAVRKIAEKAHPDAF